MVSRSYNSSEVGEAFWTQINRFWLLELEGDEFPEIPNIAFCAQDFIPPCFELMVDDANTKVTEIKFHDDLKEILDRSPTVALLNLENNQTANMDRKGC